MIGTIAACWLYFGRTVLIPLTLAILLSFLLAPIVGGFRRLRLPRTLSVLLAVALALGGMGVTGAVIVSQASTLSEDAPAYAERISGKVASARANIERRLSFLTRESGKGGSGHRKAQRAREQGVQQLSGRPAGNAIPVEVHDPPPTAIAEIRNVVLPALAPVETALIVMVVTIFILFQKEDLRDRLIRLMGSADLHRSTVALTDGAQRLSRYFLSQFVVNCGFGAIIWGGLFALGVPSPGLWGILAGLLRFVPYVGSLVAAIGPLGLAAAIDPGWSLIIWVALLFLIVEPIIGYAIEPLLYGHSTGLSPVSVVVAALFWTWIWGPIGLVLSMPLTLMLVVLGRHVPAFEFFDIMLGDRPALSPAETFYQRALAGHAEDALEQAEDLLDSMPLATFYDEVVLAGLRLAAADVDRGAVLRSAMPAICEATIDMITTLADHEDVAGDTSSDSIPTNWAELRGRRVICVPGSGPLDAAVAMMAAQLLRRAGCEVAEQSRDELRRVAGAPEPVEAEIICLLGLFDARGSARMKRIAGSIEERFASVKVVIGVQRAVERIPPVDHPEDVLPFSLTELAPLLQAAMLEQPPRPNASV
ncbi:AI-2E family transporter [Sphingomonas crusticola]|uniref:AI-2E family transporter n=1 Tax=Sphingomonas crusticola TaxID=1697973 RepID=UPI0013C29EBA|nr:AI-2E family transporter [Sphingomonas crusticola]